MAKALKLSKDRKSRERLERDELILSVARGILIKQGLSGLSMQAIADLTDYSKGTIYQHYGCKEDVAAKLVIACGEDLIAMIDIALLHGKSIRHKVVLVSAAYFVLAQRQPEMSSLISKLKSPDAKAKLSLPLQEEFASNEDAILKRVFALFSQGSGFNSEKIRDAAFGWWAMQWGLQDIMANGWDMESLGFPEPTRFYFRSLHFYLNGLGIPEDESCNDWDKIQIQSQQIFQLNCDQ